MKATLAIFAVLLLATAAAAAEPAASGDRPLITFTPYFGGTFLSPDFGLADEPIWGARLGWQAQRHWRLEGDFGYSDTRRGSDGAEVDLKHYGVDLMYQLLPGRRIDPYLLAGWAQFDQAAHAADPTQHLNGYEWAVGANFRLGGNDANNRSLRFELRDVVTDLSDAYPNNGDLTHNWIATIGLQFGFGKSSKDSDGDGVRDGDDACPGTPAGAGVDGSGCPLDADGDGVYDGLDTCPGTPKGAKVDGSGCPLDADGDGVYDGLDTCPGTLKGAKVDASGCPLDSDGDGVYDGLDACSDTPKHLKVDAKGCPIPVTAMAVELFDSGRFATTAIVFKTGSAELDLENTEELNEIGRTLADWPAMRVEIGGHTDDTGSAALNASLSERRAAAALAYIMGRHPEMDASRFTVKGYGESAPIADNKTAEGRAANRRVEFTVLNAEELRKETETNSMQER